MMTIQNIKTKLSPTSKDAQNPGEMPLAGLAPLRTPVLREIQD